MNTKAIRFAVIAVVIIAAGFFGLRWWQNQQSALPADFAFGNGRIEANQVDISTKYAGRVSEVLVEEGDLIKAFQLLSKMDTAELEAELARAKAELAVSQASVKQAEASLGQRKSELQLAKQELKRAIQLVKQGAMAQRTGDQRRSTRNTASAAVTSAIAQLNAQNQSVLAAMAAIKQIQTRIDDTMLTTATDGRVLYRLAEPGEVLSAGGKVLTVIDLSDIYMEIFLPSAQAHRVAIGAQARIKLDITDIAIPATVSFVSPEAQFTPKQVETPSEREKLMFRVKVRVPHELVQKHIDKVKTGMRGVAYIRLPNKQGEKPTPWPEFLQKTPSSNKSENTESNK